MQVFFAGGLGSPIWQKNDQSPICHESPFLDESLSPSLPAEICFPPFFFKEHSFTSRLTTFGLKNYVRKLFHAKNTKNG